MSIITKGHGHRSPKWNVESNKDQTSLKVLSWSLKILSFLLIQNSTKLLTPRLPQKKVPFCPKGEWRRDPWSSICNLENRWTNIQTLQRKYSTQHWLNRTPKEDDPGPLSPPTKNTIEQPTTVDPSQDPILGTNSFMQNLPNKELDLLENPFHTKPTIHSTGVLTQHLKKELQHKPLDVQGLQEQTSLQRG